MMKTAITTAILATTATAAFDKTYVVLPANAGVFATVTATGGKCADLLNSKMFGANTLFAPKKPFAAEGTADECRDALVDAEGDSIFTVYNTVCLGEDAEKAIVIVPGGQVCPIEKGKTCKNGQFCSSYVDPLAVEGQACPATGDAEAACPFFAVPTHLIKTETDCGEVCPETAEPNKIWSDCYTEAVKANQDAMTTNCTENATLPIGFTAPKDKKNKGTVGYESVKDEVKAKECITVRGKIYDAAKKCYDENDSADKIKIKGGKPVASVIVAKAECIDDSTATGALLCKTATGCDLPCKDGTDCTANKDVCAGECAEISETKSECTSAASQLIAGVVAVAALAVAFF